MRTYKAFNAEKTLDPYVQRFTSSILPLMIDGGNPSLTHEQLETVLNLVKKRLESAAQVYNPHHNLKTIVSDLFTTGKYVSPISNTKMPNVNK